MAKMLGINRWHDEMKDALDSALHLKYTADFLKTACGTCANGNKIIFIGNGGSASIASHMAEDYTKNGRLRSIAFNDASLLTCLANDYGYEHVFKTALEVYADKGDMLVAISSSGKSQNILNACLQAKEQQLSVITLSGFSPDNPLRQLGEINFWVDAKQYGLVEIAHLAILHCALDLHCGGHA